MTKTDKRKLKATATRFAIYRCLEAASQANTQVTIQDVAETIDRSIRTVQYALAASPRLRNHDGLTEDYQSIMKSGVIAPSDVLQEMV